MSKGETETVTLELLKVLAADGKTDELNAVLAQCRFDNLRKLLNALDVKVRSKEYAAYRTKEDHVALLVEVLTKKEAAGAGAAATAVASQSRLKPMGPSRNGNNFDAPATRKEVSAVSRSAVDRVGGFLVAGASMSSKDAERAYLVQCINIAGDALTNAESKEEAVAGLKRTLASELTYYVKRLKRIQEKDGEEDA